MKLFLHQTDPFPLVFIKVKKSTNVLDDPFKIFETFNFSSKKEEIKEKIKVKDLSNPFVLSWYKMSVDRSLSKLNKDAPYRVIDNA